MDKEGQHKKEHYQTEGSWSNKSELCPDCHGSGSLADNNTCSSCNGKGEI